MQIEQLDQVVAGVRASFLAKRWEEAFQSALLFLFELRSCFPSHIGLGAGF